MFASLPEIGFFFVHNEYNNKEKIHKFTVNNTHFDTIYLF